MRVLLTILWVACGADDPTGAAGSIDVETDVPEIEVPRGGGREVFGSIWREMGCHAIHQPRLESELGEYHSVLRLPA